MFAHDGANRLSFSIINRCASGWVAKIEEWNYINARLRMVHFNGKYFTAGAFPSTIKSRCMYVCVWERKYGHLWTRYLASHDLPSQLHSGTFIIKGNCLCSWKRTIVRLVWVEWLYAKKLHDMNYCMNGAANSSEQKSENLESIHLAA